jgi:hypothetical protein
VVKAGEGLSVEYDEFINDDGSKLVEPLPAGERLRPFHPTELNYTEWEHVKVRAQRAGQLAAGTVGGGGGGGAAAAPRVLRRAGRRLQVAGGGRASMRARARARPPSGRRPCRRPGTAGGPGGGAE